MRAALSLSLDVARFQTLATRAADLTAPTQYVTQAEDTMRMIGKCIHPGAFLADMFPWSELVHAPSPSQPEEQR